MRGGCGVAAPGAVGGARRACAGWLGLRGMPAPLWQATDLCTSRLTAGWKQASAGQLRPLAAGPHALTPWMYEVPSIKRYMAGWCPVGLGS